MSVIFEALEKVADRLIDFVRERELRRATFFKEVVEPIHGHFQEFRSQHIAMFGEVRALLRDQKASMQHALDTLEQRGFQGRNLWLLFSKLQSIEVSSKVELDGYYEAYLRTLEQCLLRTEVDPAVGVIEFYHSLRHAVSGVLYFVERTRISGDERLLRKAREDGISGVEDIAKRFDDYCASVEVCYLRLRQYCLV